MKKLICAMMYFALLGSFHVRGEFVNGIESFDGTIKDISIWRENLLNPGPSRITQDSAITMSNMTHYSTETLTVGIGQAVRVEIQNVEDYLDAALPSIGLSLGSRNDGVFAPGYYLRTICLYNTYTGRWQVNGAYEREAGGTSGTFFSILNDPLLANGPLVLEVERDTLTHVICRAYQANQNLGSLSLSISSEVPEQLFIRLENNGMTATLDNITIIPEPSAVMLLALGGLVLRFKK